MLRVPIFLALTLYASLAFSSECETCPSKPHCANLLTANSLVIEATDQSVTEKHIEALRKNIGDLLELLHGNFELPVIKAKLAHNNKVWHPRASTYSPVDKTLRVVHQLYDFDGKRVTRAQSRGAQLHEAMHAILDLLTANFPITKAIEALDLEIAARPKLEGEDNTHQIFEGNHSKYYFGPNLMFRLYSEFLCDVAAVVVTNDPHIIPSIVSRSFNNGNFQFRLEQTPDAVPIQPIYRPAFDNGRPKLSLGEFAPGYEPHVYLNPARLFVWQRILWQMPKKDRKEALRKIITVTLAEMNEQFANPELGYYKISPRELNRRLINRLSAEFAR